MTHQLNSYARRTPIIVLTGLRGTSVTSITYCDMRHGHMRFDSTNWNIVLALALLAALLVSGCLSDCKPNGGLVSWTQEGVSEDLLQWDGQPGASVSSHAATKGLLLASQHPLQARLGSEARLATLAWAHEQGQVSVQWREGRLPEVTGYVRTQAEGGPGPSETERAVETLLLAIAADGSQARAWQDGHIGNLSRGQSFSSTLDIPLDIFRALSRSENGAWSFGEHGGATVHDDDLSWSFNLPYQVVWRDGLGTVELLPLDRVVVRLYGNPKDLQDAGRQGADVLEKFDAPREPQGNLTFGAQIVCAH